MEVGPLSRRAVLLLGSAGALAACSDGRTSSGAPSPTTGATGVTSPGASATATPTATATPAGWTPGAGELEPGAKVAAVRAVQAQAQVQVIDAQYGGLLASTASVLVVTAPLHTYDVRLTRRGTGWQVTALHPSQPGPAAPRHTLAARRVLASDRIALPPAARADVLSGQVHDSVLEAMVAVGRRWHVSVSVVRSGHPIDVFGTTRPSDHPRGRAFDTWAIDAHPVVAPSTPRSLVVAYMEAVTAAGSYNTGGPYLLGAAPQWFSDRTHHDHVHAGFAA
ncbi:hypothetical protein [Nocardioides sp.]|uniref:hypothetical protein n=1 Tax=Nocardioides sp. TaxID=35761 RepID=UPI00261B95F7|nr:hypothetical protein [Nocardioides sp.]